MDELYEYHAGVAEQRRVRRLKAWRVGCGIFGALMLVTAFWSFLPWVDLGLAALNLSVAYFGIETAPSWLRLCAMLLVPIDVVVLLWYLALIALVAALSGVQLNLSGIH